MKIISLLILTFLQFSSFAADSTENRSNKKLELMMGPGIEFGIPAFSYQAGFFTKPDSLIALRFSERYDYSSDNGKKNLVAARLGHKKFTGNSFWYQPSLYWRKTNHRTTVTYDYEDVGVGIRIGNEWQWENFILGIDWAGLNHSLFKTHEEVSPGTNVPASIDVDKKFTVDFVGIYFGYAF